VDLKGIKIQKLFGQFDYTISLNQEDGITILSGPNGYGKTTILNIIYNFFKQNFFFFQRLIFDGIIFYFSEDKSVAVTREVLVQFVQSAQNINGQQREIAQVHPFINIRLDLKHGKKLFESYLFDSFAEDKIFFNISKMYPSMQRISQTILLDSNTGIQSAIENFMLQIPQETLAIINGFSKNNNQIHQLVSILSSVNVFLIEEQRLLKPIKVLDTFSNSNKNNSSISYTVQNYAMELKELIHRKQAEAFQESQKLDNSFPNRLMQNVKRLSFEEFNSRFMALIEKQQYLQKFGITISNIQTPEFFNESKSDVLSVYLDDAEKKACFFDDLVERINLFVAMINEKKFAHKQIVINSHSGFSFITNEGNELGLISLSSGEQHEVVVLYELLFRTEPNALILIDEPEISLHVSWQKAFIKDLLSISKINPISFLLATHSPQIINGRWDLTTDLYELINGEESSDRE